MLKPLMLTLIISIAFVPNVIGLGILVIGFCLFGINHGGFDIALLKFQNIALSRFLRIFFGIASVSFLIAATFPKFGFALFVFISAYHFGNEDFDIWSDSKILSLVGSMTTGAMLFLATLCYQPAAIATVLPEPYSSLLGVTNVATWMRQHCFSTVTLLIFFASGLLLQKRCRTSSTSRLVLLILVATLILVCIRKGPLLSFGSYFVLWHSALAFENQRRSLRMSFLRANLYMAPSTLVAVSAIALIYVFGPILSNAAALVSSATIEAIVASHILTRGYFKLEPDSLPLSNERKQSNGS